MDQYPYASAVMTRFLHHAATHCESLEDFYPIMKISKFVHAEEDIWEERLNGQWKRHERRAIQEAVQPFIDNPKWSQLALDVLQSSEKVDFRAMEIARFYQLDITALLFEKLKKEPTNSILYGAIMETRDLQSIQDLCAFAETHFLYPVYRWKNSIV